MHQLPISINQILGLSTAASALLSILISALWAIYFNRIKEGQKAEFQKQIEAQKADFSKQLEIIKAKNEKMNYITKTQFDAEFKMYQELSESSFQMLLDNSRLFPMGIDRLPESKEEQDKIFQERFNKANNSLVNYQNRLFKYAPFIKEENYLLFDELKEMGRLQLIYYPIYKFEYDEEEKRAIYKEIRECWKRTSVMYTKHDEIIKRLRAYLNNIKLVEDRDDKNC